jgi:pimeloyl-ACP methyl ester carboxylesterase
VRAPAYSVIHCFEGLLEADVRPELAAMAIPVLFLHGVHDIPISVEAARWAVQNVPEARLVEFAESGHAPFLEEPEKFNAALMEFLDMS